MVCCWFFFFLFFSNSCLKSFKTRQSLITASLKVPSFLSAPCCEVTPARSSSSWSFEDPNLPHWPICYLLHQRCSYCYEFTILTSHTCLEQSPSGFFAPQSKGNTYSKEANCFPAPFQHLFPPMYTLFRAELCWTHMVLPTLLQPLSFTCVSRPSILHFWTIFAFSPPLSPSLHMLYSLWLFKSCMDAQRSRAAVHSSLQARVRSHAYAHVCTSAGTPAVLDCFCAEIVYFWIIVDYSSLLPTGCSLHAKNQSGCSILFYSSFLSSLFG